MADGPPLLTLRGMTLQSGVQVGGGIVSRSPSSRTHSVIIESQCGYEFGGDSQHEEPRARPQGGPSGSRGTGLASQAVASINQGRDFP